MAQTQTSRGDVTLNNSANLNPGAGNPFNNGDDILVAAPHAITTNGISPTVSFITIAAGQDNSAKYLTVTAGDTMILGGYVIGTPANAHKFTVENDAILILNNSSARGYQNTTDVTLTGGNGGGNAVLVFELHNKTDKLDIGFNIVGGANAAGKIINIRQGIINFKGAVGAGALGGNDQITDLIVSADGRAILNANSTIFSTKLHNTGALEIIGNKGVTTTLTGTVVVANQNHAASITLNGYATITGDITDGHASTLFVKGLDNTVSGDAEIGTISFTDGTESALDIAGAVTELKTLKGDSTSKLTLSLDYDQTIGDAGSSFGTAEQFFGTLEYGATTDTALLTINSSAYLENLSLTNNNPGNITGVTLTKGGEIKNLTSVVTRSGLKVETTALTLGKVGADGKNFGAVGAVDTTIKLTSGDLFALSLDIADDANAGFIFAADDNGDFALSENATKAKPTLSFAGANGFVSVEKNLTWAGGINTTNAFNELRINSEEAGAVIDFSKAITENAVHVAGDKATTALTFTKINANKGFILKMPEVGDVNHEIKAIVLKNHPSSETVTIDLGNTERARVSVGNITTDVTRDAVSLGELKINTNVDNTQKDKAGQSIGANVTLLAPGPAAPIAGAAAGALRIAKVTMENKQANYTLKAAAANGVIELGGLQVDQNTALTADITENLILKGVTSDNSKLAIDTFNNLSIVPPAGNAKTFTLENVSLKMGFLVGDGNYANATLVLKGSDLHIEKERPVRENGIAAIAIDAGESRISGAGVVSYDIKINATDKSMLLVNQDFGKATTVAAPGPALAAPGAANGIRFDNAEAIKIANTVYTTTNLTQVEFTGADVEFADNKFLGDAAIIFNSDNNLTVTTNQGFAFEGNVSNLNAKSLPTLVVNNAGVVNITKKIDSEHKVNVSFGEKVGAVNVAGVVDLKSANLLVQKDGTNDFVAGYVSTINSIGSAAAQWKSVTINANTTVNAGIYTKGAATVTNAVLSFAGELKAQGGVSLNTNGILELLDDAILSSAVKGVAAQDGTVNVTGNAQIHADLGENAKPLAVVHFSGVADKNQLVAGNVYANEVKFDKGLISFTKASTVKAFANFVMSSANLSATEAVTVSLPTNNATFSGENKMHIGIAKANNGSFVFKDEAAQKAVSQSGTVVLQPEYSADMMISSGASRTFTAIDASTTALAFDAKNTTVLQNSGDKFSKWDLAFENGKIVKLVQSDNANAVLTEFADVQSNKVLKPLAAHNPFRFVMNDIVTGLAKDDAMARLKSFATEITDRELEKLSESTVVENVTDAAASAVNTNITVRSAAAAAAGDEATRSGVWVAGGYAMGEQKSKAGVLPYKHNGAAATLGFDTYANDSLLIGAAATGAKTTAKYQGANKGNKATINSMIGSVYLMQDFTNEIYAQVIANIAANTVKGSASRISGATSSQTVNSEYKMNGFSGNVLVGYKYAVANNVTVTPMIGMKFGMDQGFDYTETGNKAGLNLTVHSDSKKLFEGVLGAKMQVASLTMGEMQVSPEAHAMAFHNFTRKAAKTKLSVGTTALSTAPGAKVDAMSYVVGVSLTAKSAEYDLGVGYDAVMANERLSHQGSLKVRVNF